MKDWSNNTLNGLNIKISLFTSGTCHNITVGRLWRFFVCTSKAKGLCIKTLYFCNLSSNLVLGKYLGILICQSFSEANACITLMTNNTLLRIDTNDSSTNCWILWSIFSSNSFQPWSVICSNANLFTNLSISRTEHYSNDECCTMTNYLLEYFLKHNIHSQE
jgi:hypothetical protein